MTTFSGGWQLSQIGTPAFLSRSALELITIPAVVGILGEGCFAKCARSLTRHLNLVQGRLKLQPAHLKDARHLFPFASLLKLCNIQSDLSHFQSLRRKCHPSRT
jgi:hypothetical protein